MVGQIGYSLLVEHETRKAVMTELEIMPLKSPYSRPATSLHGDTSSELVLHSDKMKFNIQNE